MKIGVLTTSYPRGPGDPAGAFVRDRVRRLATEGAAVEVLAAGREPSDETVSPGVRVTRLAVGPGLLRAGAPEGLEAGGARAWIEAVVFSAALAGEARVRAAAWDALESHWLLPGGLVAAALASGRPHRSFAHGADVALLERIPLGPSLARALAHSGAELVFVSADLRARFERLCGHAAIGARVEAVPIDDAAFWARPAERGVLRQRLGVDRPLLLGVGRLVPVKGWDVLVRAASRLRPRPIVAIVGEGPARAGLVALAADRGLPLLLPGVLARSAVADWMAAADVYVQPSRVLASGRTEGMPLAAREALACGLPVVAAASGGLRELTDVVLVPPEDPTALASALHRVLDAQPATHRGASGCEADAPHHPTLSA